MGGERGNTTLPGEVVADEDNGLEGIPFWSRVSRAEILYRLPGLADSVMQRGERFDVDPPVAKYCQTEKRVTTRLATLSYMNSG